jgi:rhodanese-related sulfurtransferase
MSKKLILKDAIGAWILFAVSLLGGVVLDKIRPKPSPLAYGSPEARSHETAGKGDFGSGRATSLEGDVGLDEMQQISVTRSALILDARPEVFYRLGHIPSALSLPRDDFENRYRAIQSVLRASQDKLVVVYCAGTDCHDSQMVGDALRRLGYSHIRLFRGGWGDWESANYPEEHQ